MDTQRSMMLITSKWNKRPTFKLMPIHNDCPYNEAVFDPEIRLLAVVSKQKKNNLRVVEPHDEKENTTELNTRNYNKRTTKEEQIIIETYYEYYINSIDEIKDFVNRFAVNADIFNTDIFMGTENSVADMG